MRKYETPEMEVVQFNAEDVITTSSAPGGNIGEISLGLGVELEQ